MKNLYVTGGLGQDGKILTRILSKKKFKIFYLINKKYTIEKRGIHFIKINLLKKIKIRKIFKINKPDIILHLASNNPAFKEKNYKKFYLDNLKSSLNIFNSAYDINKNVKFVSISSSQIFRNRHGRVSEKSKTKITSPYTKFRIEFDKFLDKNKSDTTNVILFNHDSKYRNKKFLLPRIMQALKNRNYKFLQEIINSNIFGDFSHAEDICEGINKVILSKKKIKSVILSSNKVTSINSIINYVIKKNKLKINLNFSSTTIKKHLLIGDNSFAKRLLKWRHKKNIYMAANDIYNNL